MCQVHGFHKLVHGLFESRRFFQASGFIKRAIVLATRIKEHSGSREVPEMTGQVAIQVALCGPD